MEKTRETRKRILDETEELLLSRGYNGFSYQDVALAVGIRKASVHYHYAAKEILVKTYIRKEILLFRMWAKGNRDLSGRDKIFAYSKLYLRLSDGGKKICPVSVLAAEYPALPEIVREKASELLDRELWWISQTLEQGIEEGDFRSNLSIPETSLIIFNTFAGLLKTLRIHQDLDEFKGVFDQLLEIISTPQKNAAEKETA